MFDVIVIGGGPGGYKAAELLGKQGVQVALIEENELGGVCLNQGCIPFKSYLSASKICQESNKLSQENIANKLDMSLNQSQLLEKKRLIIKGLRQSIEGLLRSNGVTVIRGHARAAEYDDNRIKIDVDGKLFESSKIIIATGSDEIILSNFQKKVPYKIIGSREMLELVELPDSIDIVGGGVIGLEAACYFADAGCEVTVFEAANHIGGHIDIEIAVALKKILERKGIQIITNTRMAECEPDGILYQGEQSIKRTPRYVLHAIGRRPRLDKEILDCLDVKYDVTGILIDDACRTSNPNIYACGDVTGKLMLAHTAYRQAKVIANTIKGEKSNINYQSIPRIIYTNPEVLSVGCSEEDCQKQNIDYQAKSLPMTYSGKYFAENGKDGAKAKMIVDKDKKIIGFHMIGNGSSEISLAVEILIAYKMTVNEIANMVFPHPTYGEIIGDLAGLFE